MTLHVHDLPERPKSGVKLYCPMCGGTFSALRADYFAADPATELVHCGNPMVLVKEEIHINSITPAEAEMGLPEERWP